MLSKNQALLESGMVLHTFNLRIQELEVGGCKVQGHPQIHIQFKVSLGYIILCFRTEQSNRKQASNNKSLNKEKGPHLTGTEALLLALTPAWSGWRSFRAHVKTWPRPVWQQLVGRAFLLRPKLPALHHTRDSASSRAEVRLQKFCSVGCSSGTVLAVVMGLAVSTPAHPADTGSTYSLGITSWPFRLILRPRPWHHSQ